jgi:hypothetical protein
MQVNLQRCHNMFLLNHAAREVVSPRMKLVNLVFGSSSILVSIKVRDIDFRADEDRWQA